MRIDKYDPLSGGFRAPLAASLTKTSAGNGLGVGLNSSGQVVPGAGNSGVKGLLITTRDMVAGDIVDVMTGGEAVEATGLTAGTTITALTTTGVIGTTAADATHVAIGFTAEATRLVVRKAG